MCSTLIFLQEDIKFVRLVNDILHKNHPEEYVIKMRQNYVYAN